jgi:hypothetical protein
MTAQSTVQQDRFYLLRRVLQANGFFSGLSGLAFIFGSEAIATFLGLDAPMYIAVTGGILLLYAASLFYVAAQETISRSAAWTFIILDALWVVDSIAVLVIGWPPLTTAGKWAVAGVADVVAIIAALQYYGLRRSR